MKTFERIRAWLHRLETRGFVIIYKVFVSKEIDIEEAREGFYKTEPRSEKYGEVSGEAATNTLLSMAQTEYEEGKQRKETVSNKINALQTVAGILTSVVAGTVALTGMPESPVFKIILGPLLASFVITLWFVLRFLAVGRISTPDVDELAKAGSEAEQIQYLIRDYRQSTRYNDDRIDYLVDVYRGAKNSFVIMLLFSVCVTSWAVLAGETMEENVIAKLRANKELVTWLQGPRGADGMDYIFPVEEYADKFSLNHRFNSELRFNLRATNARQEDDVSSGAIHFKVPIPIPPNEPVNGSPIPEGRTVGHNPGSP